MTLLEEQLDHGAHTAADEYTSLLRRSEGERHADEAELVSGTAAVLDAVPGDSGDTAGGRTGDAAPEQATGTGTGTITGGYGAIDASRLSSRTSAVVRPTGAGQLQAKIAQIGSSDSSSSASDTSNSDGETVAFDNHCSFGNAYIGNTDHTDRLERIDDPDGDGTMDLIDGQAQARKQRRLAIAYGGLLLLAFTTSLEGQVTAPLAAFAVSSFHNHSLLSTVYVVQGVVHAVIKPPMAKMADVFGRLEAFSVAVLLCVAGYVQMAASQNVRTFSAAQILYSAGITGLQVLQQILVADTSDLQHRALLSSLPDTPFLITVWIGPSIAAAILATTTWRWGYAMWAILVPLAFSPLAASLAVDAYRHRVTATTTTPTTTPMLSRRRSSRRPSLASSLSPAPTASSLAPSKKLSTSLGRLLIDLDTVGILLLSVGLSMVLLPLTLAQTVDGGWSNPALGLSIVGGLLVLLLGFPAWESRPHLAPHPLVPPALLTGNRTFAAGCGVSLFFFSVFYLSVQPYFYSYLLVAHNMQVATAGRITQIFSFMSTIAAVGASIVIRLLRRYKPFVVGGACLYALGVLCMLRYRTVDAGVVRLVATQVFVGAGAGLMSVPTQIGIQASVAHSAQLVSAATAVYLTMGEVGIALGSAISGAIWGRLIPAKLEAYLPEADRGNASAIYSSVQIALSYPWGSPTRNAIIRAYQESMTSLLFVALLFCMPVIVLALLMRDYRLDVVARDVASAAAATASAASAAAASAAASGHRQPRDEAEAHLLVHDHDHDNESDS